MIHTIVVSIIDNPERLSITESSEDDGSTLFQIQVSKEDAGKLIGRKGRIAGALRTISKAAGAKAGIKVMLNVHKDPLPDGEPAPVAVVASEVPSNEQ